MHETTALNTRADHLDNLRLECWRAVGENVLDRLTEARTLFDFVIDAPKERQRWVVKRVGASEDVAYLQLGLRYATWGHSMFATVFGSKEQAGEATDLADHHRIDGGTAAAMPVNVTHEFGW